MQDYDFSDLDLNGKSVLITGGTGSFGTAFCTTVLQNYSPRKLIIYSRDELKQWEMARNAVFKDRPERRFFIGDIRDLERLEMAMRDVDIVIHAAALKQVPVAEYNPFECIKTNVHGAENVVRAAITCNVEKVIALSTDKAASPANLYGASKLAMEKILVAGNNIAGIDGPRFSVVRYGNVLGSRGSVISLFRQMLAEGHDTLPITDDKMTRFWITLETGVAFVLSCLTKMHGGEIFVPKLPSMRVVDIARAMAPDAKTEIIGIRQGEKLHEVMVTADESRTTLDTTDRYVIEPGFAFWSREPYTAQGATPVEDGFVYSSDTNANWLTPEALQALLDRLGI